MRSTFVKLLTLSGMLSGAAACGIAELALNAAEEAALGAAQDAAAELGGVAVLLTPGEATTVTVSDENSPIFGTTVDIPAGAVPESADLPLLTILPAGEAGVLETGSETVTAAGPGALISLKELLLGGDVKLALAANVAVPFPATYNVTDIVEIGHQLPDETWETLENSSVDAENNLVAGDTLSFSPFMSIRRVRTAADINPYPGACYGEYYDVSETLTGKQTFSYDANGRNIKQESEVGSDGDLNPPADSIKEYFYDGASKDVTFETYDSDGDGTPESRDRKYTFRNAAGDITLEATDFSNNSSIELRTTFEYGSNGEVSRKETNNGGTISVYLYTYDVNNFLTKEERQTATGVTVSFIVYSNDALGLALIVEYVDSDGVTVGQRDRYTYDNRGNILERAENISATPVTTDNDGEPSYQRYNYDCWE